MGYGTLNALLFVTYNRCKKVMNDGLSVDKSLSTTWLAGALGGLATWVVSTPTEVIKCRAQASATPLSSSGILRRILKKEGPRGLYLGGTVTALRDSIGYGFYFWAYELTTSLWPSNVQDGSPSFLREAPKVLLCGGLAGVATWASVFPLDMIKTRVQTQGMMEAIAMDSSALLQSNQQVLRHRHHAGAWQITQEAYRKHGTAIFFRGFTVCCIRAFIVNAVQWGAYETLMQKFSQFPE
ncbi:solute carrier family 25 (mitochondrial carnitine/acylcarnitine transporter), member 20/29 [Geosmithia morbida]|uniref:Solute carrier family 25 (Mitochondrial carnitine/acylcarnitine transporter), member 20/29 n=1 Tax=Geosmithia morbida TaxID=1094350 RepID=A0A9P4YRV3_9HYPO|nr:solute carrier family 25 (mitochondrial carnitine/acylcarnitine transporter), member 20/29 [Geosmithia morbida]KAF4121590.1 solute carrier family 25 (mitochondrial carnitine/acylcarnitine transporter), member 20/29 [Geosmithia morbida]